MVHREMPVTGMEPRDRLATRSGTQDILGVEIPTVALAVAPGRNLAGLVEGAGRKHSLLTRVWAAAVRSHILLTRGLDWPREFIARQEAAMRAEASGREEGD